MRNPFRRHEEKALTGSPEMLDALRTGSWSPIALLGGPARQRISTIYNTAQNANYTWRYTNSPAVRTVIDVVVRNIGQLDLRCYEEISESERKPRPDHDAALSLRYPNEQTTSDGLVRSLFTDWLIHDNAYALLVPGPAKRTVLMRIPAYMVEVQGDSLFQAENYRIWTQGAWSSGLYGGAGHYSDIPPQNMLHWHGENPADPRVGLSRLDTVRDVIAEDAALQAAITELANAGLTEAVWAFRPENAPELGQASRKLLEEDLGNRLRSRNRTPIVMEEGTEFRSYSVSPRDAQMMEVRRWALQRIAAVYGVPGPMAGLDGDLASAQKQFYADVLPPYCEAFTRFLNQRVLVQIYDWQEGTFEFNLEEKLMGEDRIRTYLSAAGAPIMSRNEARARMNLKSMKGGDELIVPLNVQKETGEATGKPSIDVMPPQNPLGPDQSGAHRNGGPPTEGAGTQTAGAPAKALSSGAIERKQLERLPQLHPRRASDKQRSDRNIQLAETALRGHFKRLGSELRQPTNGKKALEGNWARWTENLAGTLRRMLTGMIQAEGDIYTLKLAGENFDISQVRNYVKVWAQEAAGAINDTVRKEIDDLGLEEALARGPQHVASAGGSLGTRATLFARNEAAKQAPGYDGRVKSWVKDTERHGEWDGVTVAVGDDWPSGFAPGTAPGCRCTATIY